MYRLFQAYCLSQYSQIKNILLWSDQVIGSRHYNRPADVPHGSEKLEVTGNKVQITIRAIHTMHSSIIILRDGTFLNPVLVTALSTT